MEEMESVFMERVDNFIRNPLTKRQLCVVDEVSDFSVVQVDVVMLNLPHTFPTSVMSSQFGPLLIFTGQRKPGMYSHSADMTEKCSRRVESGVSIGNSKTNSSWTLR